MSLKEYEDAIAHHLSNGVHSPLDNDNAVLLWIAMQLKHTSAGIKDTVQEDNIEQEKVLKQLAQIVWHASTMAIKLGSSLEELLALGNQQAS